MKIKLIPKTIISILLPIIAILLVGIFFLYYHSKSKKPYFRCPESHTSEDEYITTLRNYLNNEVNNDPNITPERLAKKRYELLVDNNCTTTLKNLQNHLPPKSGITSADIIKNIVKSYNTSE